MRPWRRRVRWTATVPRWRRVCVHFDRRICSVTLWDIQVGVSNASHWYPPKAGAP